MTTFWTIAVLLAAVALAFVLPPLFGRRRAAGAATPEAANVAIYRDQMKELDADLAAGTLSAERHVEARREIELRLIDDVGAGAAPAAAVSSRWTAVAVGVAVPLAAILIYLAVGNPAALVPGAPAGGGHALTQEQIASMVERLTARLNESPDDVNGWVMLGRSNAVLGRYPESAAAYGNAVKRSPPDAQLLADYADALAMAQGRNLLGEPERLIAQALKVDPENVKALALAGTVEFEKKNAGGAIAYWERILKVVPPDSEIAGSVRGSIADAQKLAGAEPVPARKPAPAAAALSGTVSLAPALAAGVSPDDTVFIFARPVEGSRAPLAVTRKRVRDLPVAFRLDDSMAMSPQMKLSDHARVIVGARISKSGSPTRQPGDLEGITAPVPSGGSGVVVEIATPVR